MNRLSDWQRLLTYCLPVAVLLFGAWTATQWFAHRVDYHPQLGEPWMDSPLPLFAPWAWFGWSLDAASTDFALVASTSLPLFVAVAGIVWWYTRRMASTRPSQQPEREQHGADQTVALTLSDADVEVAPATPQVTNATQELSDADLLEVGVHSAGPPTLLDDSPFGAAAPASDPDATAHPDAPSYKVLQALSAHDDTADVSSEEFSAESSDLLHVGALDATDDHDAATAEAPAAPLPAEAIEPAVGAPLHVDEPRADWAYEVSTAEAPSRAPAAADVNAAASRAAELRATARFTDAPTAEAPAASDPEQARGDSDANDDASPSTLRLGTKESALLAHLAARASTPVADDTAESPVGEMDSEPSKGTAEDASDDLQDEDWLL